jgi:hypothetical protein
LKLKYDGRKPKHVAGKTKKCRCGIKKSGGKCSCGSYGKKFAKLPYPYKEDPRAIRNSRKWKKKQGIALIKKAQKIYEGESKEEEFNHDLEMSVIPTHSNPIHFILQEKKKRVRK